MTKPIFLHINRAEIGAWRASRVFMACRWFARTIAPNCDIQAKYTDYERVGWAFCMPTEDTRDKLLAYYSMIMQAPT